MPPSVLTAIKNVTTLGFINFVTFPDWSYDSFSPRHSRWLGGELRTRDGRLLDYGYFYKRELAVIGFQSHLNFLVGFNLESRWEVYHQAKHLSRLDLLQLNL